MGTLTVLSYALQALDLVPRVVAAGQDIGAFVAKTNGVIKTAQDTGKTIPDAAWDELKAVREDLQKRLHAT